MIPILFNFFKKDETSELCKDLIKNMEKFSRYNNIHRSLLYDYNLFCKK
jgi:hypothetical protein